MRTLSFVLIFWATAVSANEKVCVRNYLTGGFNTCEAQPGEWVYLFNADPQAKFETCTRLRPKSFCDATKDFIMVSRKPDGEKVCVQRFDNQLVNLCQEFPDKYSYIWSETPSELDSDY